MKSNNDLRGRNGFGSEDLLRKAAKLEPIKKSGKEKHAMARELDEEEDDLELNFHKRESVLDYYDDGEEEADFADTEDEWEEMDENDDDLDDDWEEDLLEKPNHAEYEDEGDEEDDF